jgi:hypothetical protein
MARCWRKASPAKSSAISASSTPISERTDDEL